MNHVDIKDQNIVIQNRFLGAIADLSLDERRLLMLLSPIVRQEIEENPKTRDFYINVKDNELVKVAAELLKKCFFYWDFEDGHKIKIGVSWLDFYE